MIFKLVRIDTQKPKNIDLPIGTHVIGRGFNHNDDIDKRVSRNHAELEVTGDTITLKSVHHNPCFYKKKDTEETQLLLQNSTVPLCHGDKFGLIPEKFWYEVLHCNNQENMDVGTGVFESTKNGLEIRDEGIEESDNNQRIQETEQVAEQNNATSETSGTGENGEVLNFEDNVEAAEEVDPNGSASPKILLADLIGSFENLPETPPELVFVFTAKRSHGSRESSPVDVKKVKTEPTDAADAAAQPGTSNDQPSNDQPAPSASVKIEAPDYPMRERCLYGAKCYRRNPQHKAQFSHPADPDWGSGAQGCCPYGRACRRQDPRHWDSHAHPPGAMPPPDPNGPRPGIRQKRRQRNVSENEEDSLVDDVIVTGKRVRKTVNRPTELWSGPESEGDEDPYKTDESDEWQPPSDVTNSEGFSQDF